MYQVSKRDGKVVDFDISKIAEAIKKAFQATNTEYNDSVIDFLALKVSADFLPKIKDGKVAVEDIQDSVEAVLSRGGYETVAKAYILYRKQREKMRNMKSTYLDYKDTVNKYLDVADWRVKENSTVTYSVGGLILSNSGAITANYWLSEVYDEEIANAHRNCDIHLHDLSMLTGYCAGWSLKQLIQQGLGIPGKITSSPAKHLSTLRNQMVNFLGIMQNEWADLRPGVGLRPFDVHEAPPLRIHEKALGDPRRDAQRAVHGNRRRCEVDAVAAVRLCQEADGVIVAEIGRRLDIVLARAADVGGDLIDQRRGGGIKSGLRGKREHHRAGALRQPGIDRVCKAAVGRFFLRAAA